MKLGIICGCLPSQYGIEKEALYHQLLAKKIVDSRSIDLHICSVWYTTLSEAREIAHSFWENEKPDVLIFHVRPDPYLRLSKFWISYKDKLDNTQTKINWDANDSMIYDSIAPSLTEVQRKKKSRLKFFFRQLNYFIGFALGINSKSIRKEIELLKSLRSDCESINLPLVLIGPASRASGLLENWLLSRLEKQLAQLFKSNNYVTCFGTRSKLNESLFLADGIHVSQAGHARIAELIYPILDPLCE